MALPLALIQFGQNLLGAVDTAIVGRLGKLELGAVGLGNSVFFAILILGFGVMHGLDPYISQAIGAKEPGRARGFFWQGVWIAHIIAVPIALLVTLLLTQLERFGIDPAVAVHTRSYVLGRMPGLLPALLWLGARSYLQANSLTRPLIIGVIAANVVNVPMTWLLVFGDAGLTRLGFEPIGLPAYGTLGAGLATSFCTLLQLAIVTSSLRLVPTPPGSWQRGPRPREIAAALKVGAPIGVTLLAEVGVFGIVNFLMGNISPQALAGHQVALTLASASFMIPLGIGAAASVRVGQAIGRGDGPGTRIAGLVSISAGTSFMALSALAFLFIPERLIALITDQPDIAEAALPLVFIAAVFQLSDGAQAVAAGALRGAGDTHIPLVANLAGHYLIGLPIAAALGFYTALGPRGLWWGLSAGLTAVAIALIVRFLALSRTSIDRVAKNH